MRLRRCVGMLGGIAQAAEYSPPDAPMSAADPAIELPDSNIDTNEWRQAIGRQGFRRVLRA
jgi:hypothetical protein